MLHIHHEVLGSTNDAARVAASAWGRLRDAPGDNRLPAQGRAPHPILITAARQTAGRGRCGRIWASPPGGLWLSIAWPWQTDLLNGSAELALRTLPLVVGLAIRRTVLTAIAQAAGSDTEAAPELAIKWPNDVLVRRHGRDHKLAGILCERDPTIPPAPGHATPPRGITPLIIGVGININNRTDAVSPAGLNADEARQPLPPIALREITGQEHNLYDLATAVAKGIERRVTRLQRLGLGSAAAEELNAALAWRGRSVSVRTRFTESGPFVDTPSEPAEVRGWLEGVDDAGRALIRCPQTANLYALDAGELRLQTPTVDPATRRPHPSPQPQPSE